MIDRNYIETYLICSCNKYDENIIIMQERQLLKGKCQWYYTNVQTVTMTAVLLAL